MTANILPRVGNILIGSALLACMAPAAAAQTEAVALSDARTEDIVRRSYQYVAMYNVNNKFALEQGGSQQGCPSTQPAPSEDIAVSFPSG
jgi:hypothetical protein